MAARQLIVGLIAGLALPALAQAQAQLQPAPLLGPRVVRGEQIPRFNGKPDLGGAWSNSTVTSQSRPAQYGSRLILTEAEAAAREAGVNELNARANAPLPLTSPVPQTGIISACSGPICNEVEPWIEPGNTVMRVNGQPRTSLITTPNGGPPARLVGRQGDPRPATTGTAPIGRQSDNPETRGLAERCIVSFGRSAAPPMFDQLYNSHYQFQMGTDHVAIVAEMVHDARIVRLNSTHRTDGVRPYFGDSIGWWEGDTLVVETTNLPASQAYSGSWVNLKVIERFTRVSNDRMNYRFEIHDPTMWAAPWGGEYEFFRSAPTYEYACHEGNYGLEAILIAARRDDAVAAGRDPDTVGM